MALDMGASGVKLLQLQSAGGQTSVRAARRWDYPPDVTDEETRRRMAVDAVRAMRREGTFAGRGVHTALACGREVLIKNVRVGRAGGDLAEAVRWEAEERFSFPMHSDRLRYLRAGEVRVGADSQEEVILLAVPAEAIDAHLSLVAAMGLEPQHVEVAPVASFRVYERYLRRQADEEIVSIIVDVGFSGTCVVVARGRQIVFIKNIEIGGQALSQAVADELEVSMGEARELRLRTMQNAAGGHGGEVSEPALRDSVNWTVRDAVRKVVEDLAREISLCLRYCAVTFRGLRPRQATLIGGEVYDPALVGILNEQLNVECHVGCPFRGVDTSEMATAGDRRETMTEWSVCMGLALGELYEGQERKRRDGRDRLSA
jgi:type IV pilus assembly protein PilM